MNRFLNLVGVPWQRPDPDSPDSPTFPSSEPPCPAGPSLAVVPTFYQHHSDPSSAYPHSPIEITHPHYIHVPDSASCPAPVLLDSLASAPELESTDSLLQSVDLSILYGKKKNKKKKKRAAVSVIPPGGDLLAPWLSDLGMTEYESKHQRLHDEIVAYARFISPTPTELQARQLIISAIEVAISKIFKHASLSLFGSVALDLCLPNADIDLTILADIPRQLGTKSILHEVSSGLRFAQISENSQVISRSRVPVITLTTTQPLGSFSVNISINADTGVKAVGIVRDYLDKMPALRPLVLVLKQMLSQCGLDSAANAGLSSYSLIVMVISFLQVNPNKRSMGVIDHPMENESLGILLLDFLFYYANTFVYQTSRICVTTSPDGSVLDKAHLIDSDNNFNLSISCLVNPDNDIGKPTTKLERLISAFRDALGRIESYPFSMQHSNCLGTIIGLSQSIIDHREHVSQLVTSGSLEAQINRSIIYMAKINPAFYPQTSKLLRESKSAFKVDVEALGATTPRGCDSYRPEYATAADAETRWASSTKRKRKGPEYEADYFGPRAWVDGTDGSGRDKESDQTRQSPRSWSRGRSLPRDRSQTRGSTERSRSRERSEPRRPGNKAENNSKERETKRARLD